MKVNNNKSGFTLLEIIIVIIIVGVLASLALPKFFSTVEYSRSTEALNTLGVIRSSIERCALMAGNDYTNCDFNVLDIEDPNGAAGAHFAYVITQGAVDGDFVIVATRNAIDGGNGTDTITLTVDDTTGVSRSGTGSFQAIQ